MPSISVPAAVIGGGVLSAGAGLIGAGISSGAATDAARIQAAAADKAREAQMAMYQQTRGDLAPFVQAGQGATRQLQLLTGTGEGGNPLTAPLTAPFHPTIAQLEQTPGYQFSLNQGLKSVQNSYASRGLGVSGAAMRGATDYAEGLAGTTFQDQFKNYLTQNQQIYNMLSGQTTTGENAAAQTGALGQQAQTQANALITGAGAAQAAGVIGSANAINSGIGSIGSAGQNTALLLALNNAGLFGNNNTSNASNNNANNISMQENGVFSGPYNPYPTT